MQLHCLHALRYISAVNYCTIKKSERIDLFAQQACSMAFKRNAHVT